MPQLMQVEMPGGQVVWVSAEPNRGPGDAGFGDVRDGVVRRLEGFQESVRSVASAVQEAVGAVRPDEVSVSFGVELAVARHGVVAALTGAGGKATFQIAMKWNPQNTQPEASHNSPGDTTPNSAATGPGTGTTAGS